MYCTQLVACWRIVEFCCILLVLPIRCDLSVFDYVFLETLQVK